MLTVRYWVELFIISFYTHSQMFDLNHSYQNSNKAPRNVPLRNNSISRSQLLGWILEAEEGKWIPEDDKIMISPSCEAAMKSERMQDWQFSYNSEQRKLGLLWCCLPYRNLLYLLTMHQLHKLSLILTIRETLLVMESIVISCTEPCFLFPLSLIYVFIHLLLYRTSLKIFSCSCRFYSQPKERSK